MSTKDVRRIRARVGDYLRPHSSLLNPNGLILELVALSTVESFLNDFRTKTSIEITGNQSATIIDTGRGMRLEPDVGSSIGHAEEALTTIYPVEVDDPALMLTLREWIWDDRGSLGPVVVNALCERLVFVSFREGERWIQHYERGVPRGPAQKLGPTTRSGTQIEITADRTVFEAAFDTKDLQDRLENLRERLPILDLELRMPPESGEARA